MSAAMFFFSMGNFISFTVRLVCISVPYLSGRVKVKNNAKEWS